jgi:asparagine N-glycosylation enzyme membrane subunit Stt3
MMNDNILHNLSSVDNAYCRYLGEQTCGAQFITVALLIFIGIWLTGFDKVHWFLYVLVGLFTFAGITGICPGLMFWEKIGLK